MLFKDETTAKLDAFASRADETLDYYRDILEHVEDAGLAAAVRGAVDEQARLLERLRQSRMQRDELQQAGDPERAHVLAWLAEARAALGGTPGDDYLRERIADAATSLAETASELGSLDLPARELELLAAYRESCDRLRSGIERTPG